MPTTTERPTQDDLERLVRSNVHYCVSGLIYTLARGAYEVPSSAGDMVQLCEQAAELAAPIPDYEEAALQVGLEKKLLGYSDEVVTWEMVCVKHRLEPYEWEVYEHWIVSDWLAGKLEEHGEKVDKDFAGLTVWARTTTGQSIALDDVIRRIWLQLHKSEAEPSV